MNKLHGIQYLRGLAALAVVVFHAAERAGHHFTIGAAGVDVFFVISGFIMWVIADGRALTPAKFMADRLKRIAPPYWIVTLIMVAGGLAGLFPNLVLSWQHIIGSLFFIPSRSPSDGHVWPILVQGWTLNYEMLFYAVFAVFALSLLMPGKWRLPAMTGVFAALTLFGILFAPQDPILATYTRPIVLEFLLGAFIGKWWLAGGLPAPAFGVAGIAVGLGGFAVIGITGMAFDEWLCGPLAAALVAGALILERGGMLGHSAVLNYLGDSSYSVYLWHTLAISVVVKCGNLLSAPSPLLVVAGVVFGTALGAAAYELIEKPIARMVKGEFRWPGRKIALQGSSVGGKG
jgi:exopolysaccharide production protein ExoZ